MGDGSWQDRSPIKGEDARGMRPVADASGRKCTLQSEGRPESAGLPVERGRWQRPPGLGSWSWQKSSARRSSMAVRSNCWCAGSTLTTACRSAAEANFRGCCATNSRGPHQTALDEQALHAASCQREDWAGLRVRRPNSRNRSAPERGSHAARQVHAATCHRSRIRLSCEACEGTEGAPRSTTVSAAELPTHAPVLRAACRRARGRIASFWGRRGVNRLAQTPLPASRTVCGDSGRKVVRGQH